MRPGITRGAAYAAVFLFLLSFLLAGGSYVLSSRAIRHAQANTALALANRASITQLCMSGNAFRAQQIALWEYILRLGKPPPRETAAARAQRLAVARQFDAHLHQVFAPRNCKHPAATPSTRPSPW